MAELTGASTETQPPTSFTSGDQNSNTDAGYMDYMDMVVTYRCKFCHYTDVSPKAIQKHVHSVHASKLPSSTQRPSPIKKPETCESGSQVTGFDSQGETHMKEMVAVAKSEPDEVATANQLQGSEVSQEMAVTTEEVDTQTVIMDSVTGEVVSGEATQVLVQQTSEDGLPVTLTLNGEMLTMVPTTHNEYVQMKESVDSSLSEQSLNGQTMITGEQKGSQVSEVISPEQATALEMSKEVFLCGQCNAGFVTIENCKLHMFHDHGLATDEFEEEEATQCLVVGMPPNRVSVGTQVAGKRPGRKRKADKLAEAKEPEEEEKDDSEQEIEVIETSGKRKSRPPKALTDLYYLEKRITKRAPRKPPIATEPCCFKCPEQGCYAKFKKKASLELHTKCHMTKNKSDSQNSNKRFACTSCDETFLHWKRLRIHLWRHHSLDTDLFKCEKCEFRTDSIHQLQVHEEIHTECRPYGCDICGKGFKQQSQMKSHRIIHTDRTIVADKWYSNRQCDICDRMFANTKCLRNHVQSVHSKERPFKCGYCGHATSRKAMLELHLRTHTGEKPHKCPDCEFATGDHNSLRRHQMRHTGRKPYQCQYCGYSCIQSISLKTHMKNKHPGSEGIYSCNICQYRTVNKQNFFNHQQDHNNGLIGASAPEGRESVTQTGPSKQMLSKTVSVQQMQSTTQVQNPVAGESKVSSNTIDLSSIIKGAGITQGNVSTAQLIYSALNAISHQNGGGSESGLGAEVDPNGLQPSVSSLTQDGVTTHTITFHIPQEDNPDGVTGAEGSPVVLTVQPVPPGLVQMSEETQQQGVQLVYETEAGTEQNVISGVFPQLGSMEHQQVVGMVQNVGAVPPQAVSVSDIAANMQQQMVQTSEAQNLIPGQQHMVQIKDITGVSSQKHIVQSPPKETSYVQPDVHDIAGALQQLGHTIVQLGDSSANMQPHIINVVDDSQTETVQLSAAADVTVASVQPAEGTGQNQEETVLVLAAADASSAGVQQQELESVVVSMDTTPANISSNNAVSQVQITGDGETAQQNMAVSKPDG